jgi:hypothetical protein
MKRIHLALSTQDVAASVADYSARLGCQPEVVIEGVYALWRTDTVNFSIRRVDGAAPGQLRHLGWEDDGTESFTTEVDVNGIPWERFAAHHQVMEIHAAWPGAGQGEAINTPISGANIDSIASVWQLHLEILDSEPLIWRRVVVHKTVSLAALHPILAAAMGWPGGASYGFKVKGRALADGDLDAPLSKVFGSAGDSLVYLYAPAQGWLHRVTLEGAGPGDGPLPYCLDGEGNCPPEFCAGVWDYEDLLERLGDRDDPEADALWQSIGYDFDPDRFDLAAANRRLQALGLGVGQPPS